MKCNGKIIIQKNGKKITRTCDAELGKYDIFCHKCGKPTDALKTKLSAYQNLKETWAGFNKIKNQYYSFSILMFFTGVLLTALTIYGTLGHYWLANLLLLFVVPLLLVPFSMNEDFQKNPLRPKDYLRGFKFYPRFWLFTLINILYFIFLKIICTGFLLNIASDPLLHFARLILGVYWIAIIFPVPFYMIRREKNLYKAIKIAYYGGQETRWQQFFILLFVALANIIGLAILGVGLIVTVPFSYVLMEKYYRVMESYRLFDEVRKNEIQ